MSNHIHNTLKIHSNDQVFQEIADIFMSNGKKAELGLNIGPPIFDIKCNYSTNSIYFESVNDVPTDIIKNLSNIYKNIEMDLRSSCGYFGRFFSESTFINGDHAVFKYYGPCDYRIKVPISLGYPENTYETFVLIPELFGIDRNDLSAAAKFVLQEAITFAPDQSAGEELLKDSEMFSNALDCAIKSIVKCGLYEQ